MLTFRNFVICLPKFYREGKGKDLLPPEDIFDKALPHRRP
jgi:hypothetical protein